MYNLKNKTALITGTAGKFGIGKSIALRLAAEGANIILNDLKKNNYSELLKLKNKIKKNYCDCLIACGDISKSSDVKNIVKKIKKKFGRIDILVNNAAASAKLDRVPIVELKEKVWDNIHNINLKGTFLCCKYVAREMINQKSGGKIINISSSVGKDYVKEKYGAYSSSKFAVRGLTQVLAKELGKYNIQVNAICPGIVITERTDKIVKLLYPKEKNLKNALKKYTNENLYQTPLGRLCTPNDIAQLTAFLSSNESNFITGKSITLDGGKTTD